MSALVFAPAHDSPGRNDASGAFQPEARAFVRLHGLTCGVTLFDNELPLVGRRRQVLEELGKCPIGSIDLLAFFCHGWKSGIQAGVQTSDVRALAGAIQPICKPQITIALYACDTARDADADQQDDLAHGPGGEGGFADALRAALRTVGTAATIYGHSIAGHCSKNPFTRVFRAGEVAGGRWVIEPGSELWCAWRQALRDTDLRLRYPLMAQDAIEAELRAIERSIA